MKAKGGTMADQSSSQHPQSVVIDVRPGQAVRLAEDRSGLSFTRDGVDLVQSGAAGTTVYKAFFAQGEGRPLPSLLLEDGSSVGGEDFLQSMNPDMDLSTAAGPSKSAGAGGAGEYDDDPGALLDGVDTMGSLKGLGLWGVQRLAPEIPEAPAAPETAETGAAAGGAPVRPTDPVDPPEDGGYHARVVIATDAANDADTAETFSFRVHDAAGQVPASLPGLDDITITGINSEYFRLTGIDDAGKVSFTLTVAGREALAAGNISASFAVTVGEVTYPVLVTGQEEAGYEAPNPDPENGALVSEWYETHSAVENTDVTLDKAGYNSVLITSNDYREISVEQAEELIMQDDDYDDDYYDGWRYDPYKDPDGKGWHLADKHSGYAVRTDSRYNSEDDPDGYGSHWVNTSGFYWSEGGGRVEGSGDADGYWTTEPGYYWSDYGGNVYKQSGNYDPDLDTGKGWHALVEAPTSFKGFIGVNGSTITTSGAGGIAVSVAGGAIPDSGVSGTPGATDASLGVVVGVKTGALDAGAEGSVTITARSGDIPAAGEPGAPEAGDPYVNRVYGVHAGGFLQDALEPGKQDTTELRGKSVSIKASITDAHVPEGGGQPEEPWPPQAGQSAVGIMNQGYRPIVEHDSGYEQLPLGDAASQVTVEAQNITVEALAQSTQREGAVEAVGIRNGSSEFGQEDTFTLTSAFMSIAVPDYTKASQTSRGRTILQGEQGQRNSMTISAEAVAAHGEAGTENGAMAYQKKELSAIGIHTVSGQVDLLGANEDDNISIGAAVSGDFGAFDGSDGDWPDVSGWYKATGIAVGEEHYRGGDKDAPVVTIDGGAGEDTLSITAQADISLSYVENPYDQYAYTFGSSYGIRADQGALHISNVEHIDITAGAVHTYQDGGTGTVNNDAWGVQVRHGAEVTMETEASDMDLTITSGDIGVEVNGGVFSAQSGQNMDVTVTAGQIGLFASGGVNPTDQLTTIAADRELNMTVTVNDVDNSVDTYLCHTSPEWNPLVAAVAAQWGGGVTISSGGTMDLTLDASSESGTAYAIYADAAAVAITSGEGRDTLSLTGDLAAVNGGEIAIVTGGGGDSLAVHGNLYASASDSGEIRFDLGAGNDTLTLGGSFLDEAVRLDGGSDENGQDHDVLRYLFDDTADESLESLLQGLHDGRIENFEQINIVCAGETQEAQARGIVETFTEMNDCSGSDWAALLNICTNGL